MGAIKRDYLKGKMVLILEMVGEPDYAGRVGVVQFVDDAGQLHGTWGGLAIIHGVDTYRVLDK